MKTLTPKMGGKISQQTGEDRCASDFRCCLSRYQDALFFFQCLYLDLRKPDLKSNAKSPKSSKPLSSAAINCNPKSLQKNCFAIQIKGQEKKISLRVSQVFPKIRGLQCLQWRKMVQSLRRRYKVKAVDVAGCDWIHVDLVVPAKEFAEKHYHDLKERPFFNGLCDFLSFGPVLAIVWEGEVVVKYGRKLIGATGPQKSEPGTIRGDLAVVGRNIICGSDGPETAKDEINLWFKPDKQVSYTSNAEKWVYGDD